MSGESRYMYAVVDAGAQLCLGNIGIDDNNVYTIPCRNIAAAVHSCRLDESGEADPNKAEPYSAMDIDKTKDWILAHNYVIDRASKQFGTVLPFAFGAIAGGNDDMVRNWLETYYGTLKGQLEKVRNKAEYSVQIFCEQEQLSENLASRDQELRELKEKIENMPKGAAYLTRRQFELKLKDAVLIEISMLASDFRGRIKEHVDELNIEEKTPRMPVSFMSSSMEKYKGMSQVLSLSCLVHKDKVERLGEVLDGINKRQGFAVRFTGPWAPFSFVDLKGGK